MPLIVDHEQRRNEVAEIVGDLIAEHGIERVSVKLIAARAGYSTAIVSHYFRNKSELLLLAFERAIAQSRARVEAALARGRGAADALEVFLPLDPASRKIWKVWFAFWGTAFSDPKYQALQTACARDGREIIQRVLERGGDPPDAAASGSVLQASRLFAIIGGIAVLATYDPESWPPERQRAVLRGELEALEGRARPRRAGGPSLVHGRRLATDSHQVIQNGRQSPVTIPAALRDRIPPQGSKPRRETLRRLIPDLCRWRTLSARELAAILGRREHKPLVRDYLSPMVEAGLLRRTIPEMENHPHQRYTVV